MDIYEHQMQTVSYDVETKRSYTKKGGTVYNKYCNDIFTFDIETTSAWIENGKVIGYTTGKSADYWNSLTPISLCYLWQFSFNDKVYYGRELSDFTKVLDDLPKDMNIVIWVHNLSYEFQFLSNILKWKSAFARSPHKVMKCVANEYPNVEFRCSYFLTRLSLDSWGKQLGVHKATGYLDYEKIRTPLTPLTDRELYYGEQDCKVVYHGIYEYRKKYGSIRDIPLTQTGTVRRVVKELLMSDDKYCKYIKRQVPKDAKEYKRLLNIFAGGYTHANRVYAGEVISGLIEHYDFASSYPTVMVCEKYPSTTWGEILSRKMPDDSMFENYAYIFLLKFENIDCQTYNTYIQASKCTDVKNQMLDNGRVISADTLTIWVTEQDYLTIRDTYTWDKMDMLECYRSDKRYLPKPFIDYILELYNNKTSLKGVEGSEDLYMQSKQYINSLFGMCVTSVIQPDVLINENLEWEVKRFTEDDVNERLEKLKGKVNYRDKRYFLSYSWGCWVTAYARRNLWRCIISCDENCLYSDTDSIFAKGEQDFSWYNEEVTDKLKKACNDMGIDFELTRPKTIKGKTKQLGLFEKEPDCSEFITLGAKRYVERRTDDNKLHLTVSGINKDAVQLLNDNIENFRDGFNFDKDADCVHKQLATYLNDIPTVQYPDGYVSTYKYGINLRRNGYLLTMTDDYKRLIDYVTKGIDNLDGDSILKLNSQF